MQFRVGTFAALALFVALAGCGAPSEAPPIPPADAALASSPTASPAAPPVSPTAASPTPSEPQAGRYLVIIDGALVREGPGLAFPVAVGGTVVLAHSTVAELDAIVRGDAVGATDWWGHLSSGVGFVSMAAVQPLDAPVAPAPAQLATGWYAVRVDGVFVREGPAVTFPVAGGGSALMAHQALLEIDAVIGGEPVGGSPWWGHLASGLGFVSMGALALANERRPTAAPIAEATSAPIVAASPTPTDTATPTLSPTLSPPPSHTPTNTPEPTSYAEGSGLLGAPQAGAAQLVQPGSPLTSTCTQWVCISAPSAAIGERLRITFMQFTPGQVIELTFYRRATCPPVAGPIGTVRRCYDLIGVASTAPADSRGETIFDLQTGPGDQAGEYQLHTSDGHGTSFWLREP